MGLVVCWGAKGGVGTTVTVAALALVSDPPVLAVDLAGDLSVAFGLADPTGPGLAEWFDSCAAAEALDDLARPVVDGVRVVPRGGRAIPHEHERWDELTGFLRDRAGTTVVDAGRTAPRPLRRASDHAVLVTRPCALALHRDPGEPDGVVVVAEAGRALLPADAARAVGVPLAAVVQLDPEVALAVDTGRLATHLPRHLRRTLRALTAPPVR